MDLHLFLSDLEWNANAVFPSNTEPAPAASVFIRNCLRVSLLLAMIKDIKIRQKQVNYIITSKRSI